jgi:hypothetical protein
MTSTIRLTCPRVREYACKRIREAPLGHVVKIAEETRTDEQNRLMWPLIADMQGQIAEMGTRSADDCKLQFLHALGQELRFLPALEGGGVFPVGQRSSKLSKAQFSALIEIMFHYGARHGVKWSLKSQDVLDSQV